MIRNYFLLMTFCSVIMLVIAAILQLQEATTAAAYTVILFGVLTYFAKGVETDPKTNN